MPWEIWDWYVHVAQRGAVIGRPLLTVRLGVFVRDWQDRFVPNSGNSFMILDKCPDANRRMIDNAAFEACPLVAPDELARTTNEMSVREFHEQLSSALGRPIERLADLRAQTAAREKESVERMMEAIEGGDEAAKLKVASTVASSRGDIEMTLELLERAARLGDLGAMLEAAHFAGELGRQSVQVYWLKTAADLGYGPAMYNLGVLAWELGDLSAAVDWFERSTQNGHVLGYAALVELAEQSDDAAAARRWAEAGAHAGDGRCMGIFAELLLDEGPHQLEAAARWYEKGAALGDLGSMMGAGITWALRGNKAQARYWFEQGQAAGSPHAAEMISKYC